MMLADIEQMENLNDELAIQDLMDESYINTMVNIQNKEEKMDFDSLLSSTPGTDSN